VFGSVVRPQITLVDSVLIHLLVATLSFFVVKSRFIGACLSHSWVFTSIWHCSDMFQVCLNLFVIRSLHRVVMVADLVSGFGFLIAIVGGSHATITVSTTSSFDFRLLVRESLDMCSECILCFGSFNGH
jgi:hypothetical protein